MAGGPRVPVQAPGGGRPACAGARRVRSPRGDGLCLSVPAATPRARSARLEVLMTRSESEPFPPPFRNVLRDWEEIVHGFCCFKS